MSLIDNHPFAYYNHDVSKFRVDLDVRAGVGGFTTRRIRAICKQIHNTTNT